MEAWLALAKDAVALVGGVCLTRSVLLPIATLALRFAAVDAPKLLACWRARRQQQDELKQLALRLARLETQCAQSTTRLSRRRRKQGGDDDAESAKRSLVSQAEATERSESEAGQPQRRRRLSIYSTMEKLSRVRARDDDG